MALAKYRKKPVEIECEQWDGSTTQRGVCVCGGILVATDFREVHEHEEPKPHLHTIHGAIEKDGFVIHKGQGVLLEPGDWIMPEPDGKHFYPCKPDIFAKTYEPVPT